MADEKRLIDANALLDTETFAVSDSACKECENEYRWEVMNAPTVDAVEVVHGQWVKHTVAGEDFFGSPVLHTWACNCSVCGLDGRNETLYCPNCGAKMDLEGEK